MKTSRSFLAPKFWPIWLTILLLRALACLPFKAGLRFGRILGIILYKALAKRRHITYVNSRLAFPELNAAEREQFVRDVFKNNAIGIVETAWAYWGNKTRLRERTEYRGFELIDAALSQGKGLILLGAHYSHLDLGGVLFSGKQPALATMYRQHNNPLMEKTIRDGRSTFCQPIERKQLREIIRNLKKNQVVWYGPDQDMGHKTSVFAPFFGVNAATITATTRMVKLNNSPILAMAQRRKADDSGYIIEIVPVEGFPSGDETEDACIVNRTIEACVRKAPTEYMWVHKRFKTQQDGKPNPYA